MVLTLRETQFGSDFEELRRWRIQRDGGHMHRKSLLLLFLTLCVRVSDDVSFRSNP